MERRAVWSSATFKFEKLPVGTCLCDGQAEVCRGEDGLWINSTSVDRAFNSDGESIAPTFDHGQITDSLWKNRRLLIEGAIAGVSAV